MRFVFAECLYNWREGRINGERGSEGVREGERGVREGVNEGEIVRDKFVRFVWTVPIFFLCLFSPSLSVFSPLPSLSFLPSLSVFPSLKCVRVKVKVT